MLLGYILKLRIMFRPYSNFLVRLYEVVANVSCHMQAAPQPSNQTRGCRGGVLISWPNTDFRLHLQDFWTGQTGTWRGSPKSHPRLTGGDACEVARIGGMTNLQHSHAITA